MVPQQKSNDPGILVQQTPVMKIRNSLGSFKYLIINTVFLGGPIVMVMSNAKPKLITV